MVGRGGLPGAEAPRRPRDAGCDEAMEMLDVYAELLAAGNDPSERFRAFMRTF
jgi:hypothetical protein